jgi:hypothetical protein
MAAEALEERLAFHVFDMGTGAHFTTDAQRSAVRSGPPRAGAKAGRQLDWAISASILKA